MGQLSYAYNFGYEAPDFMGISNGSLSFFPFNCYESISLLSVNLAFTAINSAQTRTVSLGLYSLNGSSLSIANSLSVTFTNASSRVAIVLTATSAAQNLTPGTWFWGFLASTAGDSRVSIYAATANIAAGNAFPGAFIAGRMTASTNALPSSYATSNLDITGADALSIPQIILTA